MIKICSDYRFKPGDLIRRKSLDVIALYNIEQVTSNYTLCERGDVACVIEAVMSPKDYVPPHAAQILKVILFSRNPKIAASIGFFVDTLPDCWDLLVGGECMDVGENGTI